MTVDRTGWPPGLLQDDDRKLSRWFAGRLGARYLIDARVPDHESQQEVYMAVARRRYIESFVSSEGRTHEPKRQEGKEQ